jgi:lactoylglutathione lyase
MAARRPSQPLQKSQEGSLLSDTPSPASFAFCKIIVNDIDGAVDFYSRAFGLQLARTIEQETLTEKLLVTPGKEGSMVVLYRHKDGRDLTLGNAWGPAGFFVADTDKAYAHAIACGATPSRVPYTTEGARVGFVLDPEGHEIELVCMVG